MGVLKVRSGGQWINVGVGGGPLPPGGVAGDILVKQSATPSDALWGTTMPKLKLTPGSTIGLDQNNPALQIGEQTGQNLVAYWSGLQSRSNGAAAVLRLNYYGGQVIVAGGQADPYLNALRIEDSTHATSRRSALAFGTGWGMGQDIQANGNKDFYVYQNANSRIVLLLSADGLSMDCSAKLRLTGSNEALTFATVGSYLAWYNGGTRLGYLQGNAGQIYLNTDGTNSLRLRGGGGLYLDNGIANYQVTESVVGTRVVCANASGYIYNSYYNMTADYAGNDPTYIAGMNNTGDNFLRWYGGINANKVIWGSVASMIQSTKVAGAWYYDQTFMANPGGTMAGYAFHPGGTAGNLRFQQNQGKYYFQSADSGGFYNCMAAAYEVTSSQASKQDIMPLLDALPTMPRLPVATMVRGLRPTWFRQRADVGLQSLPPQPEDWVSDEWPPQPWKPGPDDLFIHVCYDEGPLNCGHTPDDPCSRRVNWNRGYLGFVAEEVEQVLPHLVRLGIDMTPESLDLGSLVGLAYAMLQELDTRLNALEAA